MRKVSSYFSRLGEEFGAQWNEFWFSARSGATLVVLRQLVGLIGLVWVVSFSTELTSMFGVTGWVSHSVVHETTTGGIMDEPATGISLFFLSQSSVWLWVVHSFAVLVFLMIAGGIAPKYTTPLGVLFALSYVHRAPMVTTVFETVLCMLLLYLCFAPPTNVAQLKRKQAEDSPRWQNNIALRLIQIHLCGIYLLIAFSKLGLAAWTTGDATWYLLNDAQHRLIELDSLTASNYLANGLTHAWLGFEMAFPILIWVRPMRPLLIGLAVLSWLWTAAVTGLAGYAILMACSNVAFVDSSGPSKVG